MSDRGVKVGDRVPEFALPDQTGALVTLRELLQERGALILYFYPKDDTPGCTAEACAFRDEHQELADAGATVVGVSSDDVKSHRRFAEKHLLTFRLLSDEGGELRKKLGVPKTLGLLDGRVTYVIDAQAIVRGVFSSQLRAHRHVEEALRLVRSLEAPVGGAALGEPASATVDSNAETKR